MILLSPQKVNDATLDYSSLPEAPPPAWDNGTTYSAGQQVSYGTTGQVLGVYASVEDGNIGHVPGGSSSLGDFSDDFSDDFAIYGGYWRWLGDTYAVWESGVTYADGDVVINLTTHLVYLSVQAANVGHDPVTDYTSTWWVPIGTTNRWAMFDDAIGGASTGPSPIVVEITPEYSFNSLAIIDMTAQSVRVEVTVDGNTLYDQTKYMADGRITMGWWEYYFVPLEPQSAVIFYGLPPKGTIKVTINGTKVGTMIIGNMLSLGLTSQAPDLGIIDYSRREIDDYGNAYVVQRGFSKRYDVSMIIPASRVDSIAKTLSDVRATPALWIADETGRWTSLIVYGFYKDWSIQLINPSHAACNITIEGLVQ